MNITGWDKKMSKKITFDLERFEEWLKSIRAPNNKYKLDITEMPNAILMCDVYSREPAHPLYVRTYRYTEVQLSGRVED